MIRGTLIDQPTTARRANVVTLTGGGHYFARHRHDGDRRHDSDLIGNSTTVRSKQTDCDRIELGRRGEEHRHGHCSVDPNSGDYRGHTTNGRCGACPIAVRWGDRRG
jgi:hypothetical protein